jgi:hypothetical protein
MIRIHERDVVIEIRYDSDEGEEGPVIKIWTDTPFAVQVNDRPMKPGRATRR